MEMNLDENCSWVYCALCGIHLVIMAVWFISNWSCSCAWACTCVYIYGWFSCKQGAYSSDWIKRKKENKSIVRSIDSVYSVFHFFLLLVFVWLHFALFLWSRFLEHDALAVTTAAIAAAAILPDVCECVCFCALMRLRLSPYALHCLSIYTPYSIHTSKCLSFFLLFSYK